MKKFFKIFLPLVFIFFITKEFLLLNDELIIYLIFLVLVYSGVKFTSFISESFESVKKETQINLRLTSAKNLKQIIGRKLYRHARTREVLRALRIVTILRLSGLNWPLIFFFMERVGVKNPHLLRIVFNTSVKYHYYYGKFSFIVLFKFPFLSYCMVYILNYIMWMIIMGIYTKESVYFTLKVFCEILYLILYLYDKFYVIHNPSMVCFSPLNITLEADLLGPTRAALYVATKITGKNYYQLCEERRSLTEEAMQAQRAAAQAAKERAAKEIATIAEYDKLFGPTKGVLIGMRLSGKSFSEIMEELRFPEEKDAQTAKERVKQAMYDKLFGPTKRTLEAMRRNTGNAFSEITQERALQKEAARSSPLLPESKRGVYNIPDMMAPSEDQRILPMIVSMAPPDIDIAPPDIEKMIAIENVFLPMPKTFFTNFMHKMTASSETSGNVSKENTLKIIADYLQSQIPEAFWYPTESKSSRCNTYLMLIEESLTEKELNDKAIYKSYIQLRSGFRFNQFMLEGTDQQIKNLLNKPVQTFYKICDEEEEYLEERRKKKRSEILPKSPAETMTSESSVSEEGSSTKIKKLSTQKPEEGSSTKIKKLSTQKPEEGSSTQKLEESADDEVLSSEIIIQNITYPKPSKFIDDYVIQMPTRSKEYMENSTKYVKVNLSDNARIVNINDLDNPEMACNQYFKLLDEFVTSSDKASRHIQIQAYLILRSGFKYINILQNDQYACDRLRISTYDLFHYIHKTELAKYVTEHRLERKIENIADKITREATQYVLSEEAWIDLNKVKRHFANKFGRKFQYFEKISDKNYQDIARFMVKFLREGIPENSGIKIFHNRFYRAIFMNNLEFEINTNNYNTKTETLISKFYQATWDVCFKITGDKKCDINSFLKNKIYREEFSNILQYTFSDIAKKNKEHLFYTQNKGEKL